MDRLMLPEKIETDRLILTRLRYEEAEEIFYSYASKPEATRYLSFPTHQTMGDTRNFVIYAVSAWNSGDEYVYGIRLKEEYRFIGTIGAINDDGKVHFGYCVSPTQWGRGYATEAALALVSLLKQEKHVHRIWAFADAENPASHHVLLKCGLVEEARLIKWFRFINQDNQARDCVFFVLKE